MSFRKTSRETDLLVKIAAGEPLKSDALLVRSLCDSARGLPADSEEWDVSGLLLDGQPFSRETVSCWLSCANSVIHGDELSPQEMQQLSTVTGLTHVLAFADAVGSYTAVCRAACSQASKLKLMVQLAADQVLDLPLVDKMYSFQGSDHTQLARFSLQEQLHSVAALASAEQTRDVQQQVAKQLSNLLQLAHVLRLQPLLYVLHQFLLLNVGEPEGKRLLSGVAGSIFTDAVFEAAQGSSTLSKEAYISSVLSQPCSLTPNEVGHSSLLRPTGTPTYSAETKNLTFEAVLLQSFAGARAGDTVKVLLNLFGLPGFAATDGGKVTMYPTGGATGIWLPVQLLLGRTFSDAAALEGFLANPSAE